MSDAPKKTVLHLGSGLKKPGRLHPLFSGDDWEVLRLDTVPDTRPDLVSSLTDMRIVETAEMDAVFSSHDLEHLYPHEVPKALAEIRRVLKKTGLAVISLPDLQSAAQAIAQGQAARRLYDSPMGPVTALDIVYGHHKTLASGNPTMLHKSGFTAELLQTALEHAGFASVQVRRDPQTFSLWAMAHVSPRPKAAAEADADAAAAQGGPFGNGGK